MRRIRLLIRLSRHGYQTIGIGMIQRDFVNAIVSNFALLEDIATRVAKNLAILERGIWIKQWGWKLFFVLESSVVDANPIDMGFAGDPSRWIWEWV